ncbi:MAG TPA: YlxR family protein [Dictyoglomaceae bacterium]|nr:YlxR family protein [Dictyoglomaceae bacterium]HOL39805.1 YlxR family protein [Dictyoglomaceae bacterium]HOP95314.1 YlxR family protein [Dictyoglomaceae bacterium]HPP16220.1 YlxR family protein [Dictyoglomaceae bacterium]HPU42946.1 YlxR family protein [Dictyoglomaceae bacterium]
MSNIRHIPLRTCIGCGEKKAKRELIRIVRKKDKILFDSTGKVSGRGTYICPKTECLEKALKKKALSRALKCDISPENLSQLKEDLLKEILLRGRGCHEEESI